MLLTGGGIIPPQDIAALGQRGIGKLFGPGSPTKDAIDYIKEWSRRAPTLRLKTLRGRVGGAGRPDARSDDEDGSGATLRGGETPQMACRRHQPEGPGRGMTWGCVARRRRLFRAALLLAPCPRSSSTRRDRAGFSDGA